VKSSYWENWQNRQLGSFLLEKKQRALIPVQIRVSLQGREAAFFRLWFWWPCLTYIWVLASGGGC